MSYINIIQPSLQLASYVKQYTVLKANELFYATQRVIPVGCVELIIYKSGSSIKNDDRTDIPRFFLGGNRNSYLDLTPEGGCVHYISILFQPYGARLFFDLPLNEIYGQIVSVGEIGDKAWMELCNRITDIPDIVKNINIIESFLIKKLSYNQFPHLGRIITSLDIIHSTSDIRLNVLAQNACLSKRQFQRIFQNYIGCNPKEYMRIVRFNKVLHILTTQKITNFAQMAQEFGYSDQSHLIREFKAFSGYTPLDFLTPDVGFHHFL